jgi:hypothetical protein
MYHIAIKFMLKLDHSATLEAVPNLGSVLEICQHDSPCSKK